MKKRFLAAKRIGFVCSAFLILGILSGCGDSGTEERIKTGEERALELKKEAQEVVDQINDNTDNLTQDADQIEE
ncbi:MAG: hypothetical protein IJ801_05975 [Lachnospiraceae bacterium]|nr:hypothetical protein [Lachnospiraceae bacterium]